MIFGLLFGALCFFAAGFAVGWVCYGVWNCIDQVQKEHEDE